VRFVPGTPTLTHPKEKLATRVSITREMCAGGLKYIAPVLAGVTSAEGQFSIELDKCEIPLDDPTQGEVAGRFMVHSIEIGPGMLVKELAAVLGRAGYARLEDESTIPFRMADGRVHHQNLGLVFPEFTIRSAGSVGFDQSLDLRVEVPVPTQWMSNLNTQGRPLLGVLEKSLEGQTIQVAVGGTLQQPRLDRARLQRQNRQFIERATRNVIRDQIDRGLQDLFAPPRR